MSRASSAMYGCVLCVACGPAAEGEIIEVPSEEVGIVQQAFTGTNTQDDFLQPSPGYQQQGMHYGAALDVAGAIAAVGAPKYDVGQSSDDNGMLWAYRRTGSGGWYVDGWIGGQSARMGDRIAVHNSGIVVASLPGATANGVTGVICRFAFNGTSWSSTCLTSGNVKDVAIHPLGTYIATANGSTVNVYWKDAAQNWLSAAILVPGHGGSSSDDALSVTFVGYDRIAVGAPKTTVVTTSPAQTLVNAGKVYVFKSPWVSATLEKTLVAPTPRANAYFGAAVDASDPTLVVGSPSTAGLNPPVSAAVYPYVRTGTSYTVQAFPAAPLNSVSFGASVGVDGARIVVGDSSWTAPGPGSLSEGNAYSYVRTNGIWAEQYELVPNTRRKTAYMGVSVAVDVGFALVGAREDDFLNEFTDDFGEVYGFNL